MPGQAGLLYLRLQTEAQTKLRMAHKAPLSMPFP